jgi:hypothetical protein
VRLGTAMPWHENACDKGAWLLVVKTGKRV